MQNKETDIDLCLTVICCVMKDGQTLTQRNIADICGCSRALIYETEQRALRKLKQQVQRHIYLYDFIRPDIELTVPQQARY